MGPEIREINIQARHLAAAHNWQSRGRDEAAAEYNRGQSLLSVFNRGKERMAGAVASVKGRISILSEFRARDAAAVAPAADFPQVYAQTYAREHVELSRGAVGAAVENNVNTGWFSNLHSTYLVSDRVRLLAGAGLAAYGYFSGVDAQTAMNFYEAGAIVGGPGLVDTVRRTWLSTTTRMADAGANVAEIRRRWGSEAEGWVSGDKRNPLNANQTPELLDVLSGEASFSLARDLQEKLESEGVSSPRGVAGVNRLREATARVAEDYDLITPAVRARDSAKPTRAMRTVLAGLVIAGALTHHFLRPVETVPQPEPDCGTLDFSSPDWINGRAVGNPNAHSLNGAAQARLLRHVSGKTPDLNAGAGWGELNSLYGDDETVVQLVDGIAVAIAARNVDNIRFLTSDLVEGIADHEVRDLCPVDIEAIARNTPRKPARLRP